MAKDTDRAYESAVCQGEVNPRLDRTNGVVKGLKVLGRDSRNNRGFSDSAFADVAKQINSGNTRIKANLNHPDNLDDPNASLTRRVQDKFGGWVKGSAVVKPGDGTYADLRYNPEHQFARQFEWFVENDPEMIGCSVDAILRGPIDPKTGRKEVTSIPRLYFIDIVGDPGSTQGLFESDLSGANSDPMEGVDQPAEGNEADQHLVASVAAFAGDMTLTCAEKLVKIRTLLKLMDEPEEKKETMSPEDTAKAEKLEKENTDLKLEISKLKVENTDLHAREQHRISLIDAAELCKKAELPERAVTQEFLGYMADRAKVDGDRRSWESMIRDRKVAAEPDASKTTSASADAGKMTPDQIEKFLLGGKK